MRLRWSRGRAPMAGHEVGRDGMPAEESRQGPHPAFSLPPSTPHNTQPAPALHPAPRTPHSALRIPHSRPSAFRFPSSAWRPAYSACRTPHSAQRTRHSEGFTLIEIIVVITIIAVASAVVMPSMRLGLAGMRLEAKGRDLATLCRAARTLAVGEQRVYRIGIERDKGGISLVDAYHQKVRDFDLTDEINLEAVKYEGEEVRAETFYINFYPNGRADEAELVLKNDRGRRVILKTDVLTGTARLVAPRELR